MIFNRYNLLISDINKATFLTFSVAVPFFFLFDFIIIDNLSHLDMSFNIQICLLISIMFSTIIAYKFNSYLYNKLKTEEININAYLKLIILDFSLINSFFTRTSDKCLNLIESVSNYNFPISDSFKSILRRVQYGNNPEEELEKIDIASKDFVKFLRDLIIDNFENSNLLKINDFSYSENLYETFTKSIESKLSLIFFIGLFLPIGTCFLIIFQAFRSFFLILIVPIFFVVINYLSTKLLHENLKLIGILSSESRIERKEFNHFLSFIKNFAIILSRKKSPEYALYISYKDASKFFQSNIEQSISLLIKNSISLEETFKRLKNALISPRCRLILNVLIKMVMEDTFHTAHTIWELLEIIRKHQKLEAQKRIIIRGEKFKSIVFIFLLPLILGIISGTFPAFFYYLNLINKGDFYDSIFLFFTFNVIDVAIIFCSFFTSNLISVYFFSKIIRIEPKRIIVVFSNIIFSFIFIITFTFSSNII